MSVVPPHLNFSTTFAAELLNFDDRFTAFWASLLNLYEWLAAVGTEVPSGCDVMIGAAFHKLPEPLEMCVPVNVTPFRALTIASPALNFPAVYVPLGK